MKILQTNIGRGKMAHDLGSLKGMIDILVVAGPNHAKTERGWIRNRWGDVGVYLYNKNIKVSEVKSLNGLVTISLEEFTLISGYISPNIPINKFRDEVGNVIVVGDFNLKARKWGSLETDRRGELLMEGISSNDLTVINDSTTPTYVCTNRSSFIDLTIASRGIAGKVADWRVENQESLSGHVWIIFEVQGQISRRPGVGKQIQINHIKYERELRRDLASVSELSPELAETYMKVDVFPIGRTNK